MLQKIKISLIGCLCLLLLTTTAVGESFISDTGGTSKRFSASGNGTTADPYIPHSNIYSNIPQQALIYMSMTLDGEFPVTGVNRNMNVNGSVTPKRFRVGPPAGQIWQLTRMVLIIRDTGSFDSGGWGNNGGIPLTVGIEAGLYMSSVEYNMTPVPWNSHVDLAAVAYDVHHENFGQGDEYLVMRLTFSKAGANLRLIGDDGDYIWIDVNDDLTFLVEQRVMVQGFMEDVYL